MNESGLSFSIMLLSNVTHFGSCCLSSLELVLLFCYLVYTYILDVRIYLHFHYAWRLQGKSALSHWKSFWHSAHKSNSASMVMCLSFCECCHCTSTTKWAWCKCSDINRLSWQPQNYGLQLDLENFVSFQYIILMSSLDETRVHSRTTIVKINWENFMF